MTTGELLSWVYSLVPGVIVLLIGLRMRRQEKKNADVAIWLGIALMVLPLLGFLGIF